jgi:hypothetical protein
VVGLDGTKEVVHPKVDQKSTIKHAQERASREVFQGRHKLITRVLREGMVSNKVNM